MDVTCSVCGKHRDTCNNCGMCLLCADESVKEGEGACPDCATRLLQWSNTWRLRWHDAANMQHKLLRSISKELGEAKAEIERLQSVINGIPKLVELVSTDCGIDYANQPTIYQRGKRWRYHRIRASNFWMDGDTPLDAALGVKRIASEDD